MLQHIFVIIPGMPSACQPCGVGCSPMTALQTACSKRQNTCWWHSRCAWCGYVPAVAICAAAAFVQQYSSLQHTLLITAAACLWVCARLRTHLLP